MMRAFEFSAGALSLAFVDTVAQRVSASVDLLTSTDDLWRWLIEAGLAERVLDNQTDPAYLATARDLREAIYRAALALIDGQAPNVADISSINSIAAFPDLRPQFVEDHVAYCADDFVRAAMSTIAADAILLLAPDKRNRLRQCEDCRMLFRDNSRPGKRKWCSSSSGCGNRAKVRRHRSRNKKESNDD